MISRPEMILIGSTGRGAGRTEFVCELIKQHALHQPVTALKITTIFPSEGVCRRGGEGCGVCRPLEGGFTITEEHGLNPAKDTSRMRRAGAHRVLWLRVRPEHLAEGVEALLELLPEHGAIVCGSTSARHAIEPGLFLICRPRGGHARKASANELMHLADRVVEFSGTGWDLLPEQCHFRQGAWFMTCEAMAFTNIGE